MIRLAFSELALVARKSFIPCSKYLLYGVQVNIAELQKVIWFIIVDHIYTSMIYSIWLGDGPIIWCI